MDAQYVRNRITELRMLKGVSEYRMSYDLGHSRSYINNITSGKALPSIPEFFAICDYFEITPVAFFDEENKNPELLQKVIEAVKRLDNPDLLLILSHINRLEATIKQ